MPALTGLASRPDPAPHEPSSLEPRCTVDAAFTAVFLEHRPACLRLARRLVREEGQAHEVVQEVFLAWWRSGGGGYRAEHGELARWLLTITHHKAVDAVRASERRRRLHVAAVSESSCAPEERHIDEVVWWKLGAQSLSAAWPTLTPMQREVLDLAYETGLTQSQIADRLGIPIGTVKSRTHAGMVRLREAVGGSWSPTGPTAPVRDPGPSPARRTPPAGRPPESRAQAAAAASAATDELAELAEQCATGLVRLVRDGHGGRGARAELADRTAALVDEHGEAGMHALVLSLAHLAAGPSWGRRDDAVPAR